MKSRNVASPFENQSRIPTIILKESLLTHYKYILLYLLTSYLATSQYLTFLINLFINIMKTKLSVVDTQKNKNGSIDNI